MEADINATKIAQLAIWGAEHYQVLSRTDLDSENVIGGEMTLSAYLQKAKELGVEPKADFDVGGALGRLDREKTESPQEALQLIVSGLSGTQEQRSLVNQYMSRDDDMTGRGSSESTRQERDRPSVGLRPDVAASFARSAKRVVTPQVQSAWADLAAKKDSRGGGGVGGR